MHQTTHDPHPSATTTLGAWDRRRCVRCGAARPEPELFICATCRDDPQTRVEMAGVEEFWTDYREQRHALRLAGWAGGWWRA
jgi:hypothetical protein